MALAAQLDNLDGVAEALHGEYVEVDGVFRLDVTPVNGLALEDVGGLKSALSKERTSRTAIERDYNKVKKEFDGIDPSELIGVKAQYDDTLTKYEALLAIDPASEADKLADQKVKEKMTKAQKDWKKLHDEEVGGRDTKIGGLTNQLKDLLINSTAVKALSEAGGAKNIDLLTPHVLSSTKLVDEADGSYSVQVVDKEGNARVRSDGGNMTIADLMPEFQEKWPTAFVVDVKPGGGAKPTGKPAKPTEGEKTSKDKIREGLAARKAG